VVRRVQTGAMMDYQDKIVVVSALLAVLVTVAFRLL
jgi:hypothetical protein